MSNQSFKRQLLSQLRGTPGDDSLYPDQEKLVIDRLNQIRQSTSLIIIGNENRSDFIKRTLLNSNLSTSDTILLDGKSCINDSHALLQIADYFLIRNYDQKNSNIILEDLESYFKQRKIENNPAIIIIDYIEEFTKKDKQVLLYTLLDFIHKSEMFFILIVMSPCYNLHTTMEKRVISRLNSTNIYLNSPNAIDICKMLSIRLTIGQNYDPDDKIVSSIYKEEYNKSVYNLFGSYTTTDTTNNNTNSSTNNSSTNKGNNDNNNNNTNSSSKNNYDNDTNNNSSSRSGSDRSEPYFKKGALYRLIECYVNWGYSYK